MPEFETKVKEIIQRAHKVKSFRFAVGKDVSFLPGQFFFVTIKINGEEATKHFSFSNSPTETGYIEFTKKLTESEFSKALDNLKVGDWARLRLAYGRFTPEEEPKIAFLAGGIGITPVRSISKFATDKKLSAKITVLYSSNTFGDIAFKEDFEEMEAVNKNLKVVHTITLPDDSRSWKGRIGRINGEVIKEEIADYLECFFYICGPPGMVEAMKEILTGGLKLDPDRVKIESFAGYE